MKFNILQKNPQANRECKTLPRLKTRTLCRFPGVMPPLISKHKFRLVCFASVLNVNWNGIGLNEDSILFVQSHVVTAWSVWHMHKWFQLSHTRPWSRRTNEWLFNYTILPLHSQHNGRTNRFFKWNATRFDSARPFAFQCHSTKPGATNLP